MLKEEVETRNISVKPVCFAFKLVKCSNSVSSNINKMKYIYYLPVGKFNRSSVRGDRRGLSNS